MMPVDSDVVACLADIWVDGLAMEVVAVAVGAGELGTYYIVEIEEKEEDAVFVESWLSGNFGLDGCEEHLVL